MYALVEDSTIKRTYNNPRGMTIGGVQYPQNIHSLWSESDLNAIGIYTVVYDDTNKRDGDWYINTNQTLAFAGGVVTASYGTATAKLLEDRNEVDEDDNPLLDDNGNQVVTKGLKTIKKELIDKQCAGLLAPNDWRVTRQEETGNAMDSGWKTYRASVTHH